MKCTQFTFLPLLSLFLSLCYNASGTTDYLAYLPQEKKKRGNTTPDCQALCVWQNMKASGPCLMKQSVGRLGGSVSEAKVAHWPDTAGKKRTTLLNKAERHSFPFPFCMLLTPSTSTLQRQREGGGLLADTQWVGCVKNCEYVTTRPYKAERHGAKVCMCVRVHVNMEEVERGRERE